jgi:hypothetical protein
VPPRAEPASSEPELDLDRVAHARRDGQVLNHRDWQRDWDRGTGGVERVDLSAGSGSG